MHLIKNFFLVLLLILFITKANSSIFVVDNYSFTTTIKKIKKNRTKVIEEIKQKSLDDFLRSVTIQSDFANLNKINNYQEYFKVFIVKDEFKKQNDNYEIICKIEFDQLKINNLFKSQNIKYINFKSNPILAILVNKKDNKISIWSTENFEKNWNKNKNNLLNAFPLNGDLTDIKLLNEIDVKSYQVARLDKIVNNYGIRDFIFILFDYDLANKKENVFVRSQFNELKITKKYSLEKLNEITIEDFFNTLLINLNNSWKEIQILSPLKNNSFTFIYELKDLSEYVHIKKILNKNKSILNINDIEVSKKAYVGKISFSGTMDQFKESLVAEGLIYKKNNGKIFLLKK